MTYAAVPPRKNGSPFGEEEPILRACLHRDCPAHSCPITQDDEYLAAYNKEIAKHYYSREKSLIPHEVYPEAFKINKTA